jgi:hypothetical protein
MRVGLKKPQCATQLIHPRGTYPPPARRESAR